MLVTGNPGTGFVLTGPFDCREDAIRHAMNHLQGAPQFNWCVLPLFKPKE